VSLEITYRQPNVNTVSKKNTKAQAASLQYKQWKRFANTSVHQKGDDKHFVWSAVL